MRGQELRRAPEHIIDNGDAIASLNKPTFAETEIELDLRFVGWIDLMGASSMMLRSPEAAYRSIGCLHEAMLRSVATLPEKIDVTLHPLADGVYVVAKEFHVVATILSRAFRSYAHRYLSLSSESRSCPLRAAIAYGRVSDMASTRKALEALIKTIPSKRLSEHYLDNLVQGTAFSHAYGAERKAPPFGVYHDESLRHFGKTESGLFVTWPFLKWWFNGQKPTEKQHMFARRFGKCVLEHFDWIERHPVEAGMSGEDLANNLASYRRLVEEYFDIETDFGKGVHPAK